MSQRSVGVRGARTRALRSSRETVLSLYWEIRFPGELH